MVDVLQETLALQLKREPWLVPDVGSWWLVTSKDEGGTGGIGGDRMYKTTLIDCICQVGDYGDGPIFEMFGGGSGSTIVPATEVAYARRLVFVLFDDPSKAFYLDEQDIIDNHKSRELDTTASAQGVGGRDKGSRTGQDFGHRMTSPQGGTSDSTPSARGPVRSEPQSRDSESGASE